VTSPIPPNLFAAYGTGGQWSRYTTHSLARASV